MKITYSLDGTVLQAEPSDAGTVDLNRVAELLMENGGADESLIP